MPACLIRSTEDPLQGAVVCASAPCDFNHDGSLDVRDLVLMVNCLNEPCIVLPGRGDCNGDSTFTLDDVLCCATRLLRESVSRSARPTPTARSESGIGVSVRRCRSFARPSRSSMPVRLTGRRSAIGGAQLDAAGCPAIAYDAEARLATNHRLAPCCTKHSTSNRLVLGLIQTRAGDGGRDPGRPRPGAPSHASGAGADAGGTVALRSARIYSGRDGVRLIADGSAGRGLELGAAAPPDAGAEPPESDRRVVTRFALIARSTGRRGCRECTTSSGRRVATLLTGPQDPRDRASIDVERARVRRPRGAPGSLLLPRLRGRARRQPEARPRCAGADGRSIVGGSRRALAHAIRPSR